MKRFLRRITSINANRGRHERELMYDRMTTAIESEQEMIRQRLVLLRRADDVYRRGGPQGGHGRTS